MLQHLRADPGGEQDPKKGQDGERPGSSNKLPGTEPLQAMNLGITITRGR